MKKKKTRNKFEKKIELQLKKAKAVFTYETEKLAYVLAKHYIPDFIIQTPLGKIYVELKGYLRPEDRSKMAAVKRQYPHLDIRILFYVSRPAYIKWATRHGFRFAFEKIPLDWLEGL